MRENPRKQEPYVRLLELISIISEDWGEGVKEVNNFIGKGWDRENAEKAIQKLQQIQSPINEMAALLEVYSTIKGVNVVDEGVPFDDSQERREGCSAGNRL